MAVSYKQKCRRCKQNWVVVGYRNRNPLCFECEKDALTGEITDPEMKKMFKIPEEFYKQNAFLRDIKINYLKYKRLTEKQIEAFKKAAEKLKEEKKAKK